MPLYSVLTLMLGLALFGVTGGSKVSQLTKTKNNNHLRIAGISLQVRDCSYCNMDSFGGVMVKVCGKGTVMCCETDVLDHPLGDDFESGDNYFGPDYLGPCQNFDLGSEENLVTDLSKVFTVFHGGPDGVQFNFGRIHLDNEMVIECEIERRLDNVQYANGVNCQYI